MRTDRRGLDVCPRRADRAGDAEDGRIGAILAGRRWHELAVERWNGVQGLLDEIVIHLAPVLLGEGVRLFGGEGDAASISSRILGSMQDAEDAVQETLLSARRGLGRFEERASLDLAVPDRDQPLLGRVREPAAGRPLAPQRLRLPVHRTHGTPSMVRALSRRPARQYHRHRTGHRKPGTMTGGDLAGLHQPPFKSFPRANVSVRRTPRRPGFPRRGGRLDPQPPLEYQGRAAIAGLLRAVAAWRGERRYRLIVTRANTQPADRRHPAMPTL